MSDIFGPLRSIMYELFYLDDIDRFVGLDPDAFARLQSIYPQDRIERFQVALGWAAECQDFDFRSLLPNLPFDNQQIATYLERFHRSLEQHAADAGWPSAEHLG